MYSGIIKFVYTPDGSDEFFYPGYEDPAICLPRCDANLQYPRWVLLGLAFFTCEKAPAAHVTVVSKGNFILN